MASDVEGIQIPSAYHVEESLGSDITTATLRAIDARDGQTVALRVPRLADATVYERLRREAVIAASVEHRYVARLLRYDDDGRPCLALEELAATLTPGGRELSEMVAIVGKVAAALDYLHGEGVMHVSLAAPDIGLAPDGSPRLLNLGCAYLAANPDEFYWLQASAETIAPELLCGRLPTPASDVYSLGLLVYSLLAGANPFAAYPPHERLRAKVAEPAPPLRERAPHADPAVGEVVERAMDEAPARRYRTAGAFALALARSVR
ncbi:MAG: serine/threonine-protein kinase [Anaerolineae bacterium]